MQREGRWFEEEGECYPRKGQKDYQATSTTKFYNRYPKYKLLENLKVFSIHL